MGRRKVVEITCDRCGRTETQGESEVSAEDTAELVLEFGEKTTFQDLCRRCRSTVENYVRRLRMEDRSEEEAPAPEKNPTGVKKGPLGVAPK